MQVGGQGRWSKKLSPKKFCSKIPQIVEVRETEGAIKQIIAYIKAQTKRVMTPRRGVGWEDRTTEDDRTTDNSCRLV